MKDEEVALFRKQLLDKLKVLKGDVNVLENDVARSKKDSATHDISKFADLGSDNYEVEFDMEMLETESEEIQAIVEAIKRTDDGTFGTCAACSKRILKPRLRAIPYAKLCVKCKTMEEENGGPLDL
ncbi:MAG: TraR/DksA C4-type zinc finger protein [Planctomycetes bacterium]|nr:TraR/DksA C4-type zinc finger protein [Planctomycetota bacterium]